MIHDAELAVGELRHDLNALREEFVSHLAEAIAAREKISNDVKEVLKELRLQRSDTADLVAVWKAASIGSRAVKWLGAVTAALAAIGAAVVWIGDHIGVKVH